ncbi:MAG: glycosyltransferase [Bacteroidetes bacterium]|nr:MAG: glycosyltransferase [Bacteroidota bacterium]
MILLLIPLFLYLFVQAFVLAMLLQAFGKADEKKSKNESYPLVSVLVAARNEEEHIMACLASLAQLDYPADRLEFLIGNDQSEDRTAELVQAFCDKDPRFKLIEIESELGNARKKANVLAHLAHAAQGDFFFITDADIEVPTTWVSSMMPRFTEGIGCVSATTTISGKSGFARMQHLDWLYFMGILFAFDRVGLGATAVGNNMAVRKEAYWATGGYEKLPFSITEDFLLYKAIKEAGWKAIHLCEAANTNGSEPAPTWGTLMQQRKRWLTGGQGLPLYWKMLLVLFGSFQPFLILGLIFFPQMALYLWFTRFLIQSFALSTLSILVGQKSSFLRFVFYEFYSVFLSLVTPIYFLLPSKKKWKGRDFETTHYA